MSNDTEALPFGEWDVEAVAALFEKPWYRRLGRVQPSSIAKLLRDLWREGTDMGKLYAKLQIDSQDRVRDEVSKAEKKSRAIANRIDLALNEMTKSKASRGYGGRSSGPPPEVPAYIVLSPAQVVALYQDSFCDYSASGAISTTHRTYKKLPIVSASGVYGPIVMTQEAFDGFSRMAPELDIRLR